MYHIAKLSIPTDKKCLIIGKGPTFSKVYDLDLNEYFTIGLNHVTDKIKVDIGHCIDLDVLSNRFIQNSKVIVVPWHPHINFKATKKTLPDLMFVNEHLENAIMDNRLFYYYCSTYRGHFRDDKPIIRVKYFSVEAAFNILVYKKIRTIYTLGIDGGKSYAKEFCEYTPLKNGHPNFDKQFIELNKIVEHNNINWIKL